MKKKVNKFEWPEFNSDRERIKHLSKVYKDYSIVEAFESEYKLSLQDSELANETPTELAIGNILKVYIKHISKNKVDFDVPNSKSIIHSNTNLYKYKRFKNEVPSEMINVIVTNIDKNKVTVDPLGPMMNDWLSPLVFNPSLQKVIGNPQYIKVKNLQLTRGGFIGDAVIPTLSKFVGEDYTIPAFIPGSQIVLNITDNFEQFVGKTVDAFVVNYMNKPNNSNPSLICSVKELIKFKGEELMIQMHKDWCEENDEWKEQLLKSYAGKVTGVINSSKKCGIFVEIPELHITGMIKSKPEELVNYKPGQSISIKVVGFEEEMFYNPQVKQMQHVVPYVIENDVLTKCSLKPIFQLA